jgi:endoglycosylceramidase
VFWEAIEPLPGVYDETYLTAVRALVDEAGSAGLRVVVDMHQDLWGAGFGQAGAPRWTCDESLYATFRPQEPWFMGYFEHEVGACFGRLYQEGPTRAAFVGVWGRLARALAGSEAVLAYEPINEPFWGGVTPEVLEGERLPDLYAEVADAIRSEDPGPWVALDPASIVGTGASTYLEPPARERLIYAPHFYPPAVELHGAYDGDALALVRQAEGICADATRLGRPAFVGEIGVRRDVGGAADYVAEAYDALDDARLGAFAWDASRSEPSGYGLFDPRGRWTRVARALARPHPSRVAGTPQRWSWDRQDRTFELTWIEDGLAGGETIVTLPRLAFPAGVAAAVDDGAEITRRGSRLHIPQLEGGGLRRLVIKPRSPS